MGALWLEGGSERAKKYPSPLRPLGHQLMGGRVRRWEASGERRAKAIGYGDIRALLRSTSNLPPPSVPGFSRRSTSYLWRAGRAPSSIVAYRALSRRIVAGQRNFVRSPAYRCTVPRYSG